MMAADAEECFARAAAVLRGCGFSAAELTAALARLPPMSGYEFELLLPWTWAKLERSWLRAFLAWLRATP